MIQNERLQLVQIIANLEAQRTSLGDAVVASALAPLQARLHELELEDDTQEERKQVTVLFADLAGFTALFTHLDPEDVRTIMNTYFQAWRTVLTQHGGVIEKFIGDAVLAVFGIPQAREDDPIRALHAGLAMRTTLSNLNEIFARDYHIQLTMRVGIHTGPVLASQAGFDDTQHFTVVGHTVNTASRLEQAAPHGGILISHTTYRHVRGIFRMQAAPPLTITGRPQPLQVFLVEEALPPAFRVITRGVEGVATHLVGRDTELATLSAIFNATFTQVGVQVVHIVGEAGMGKSRLLDEFDHWLDLQPIDVRYFRARATPQTQATPGALLRDMLANRFAIRESDPADLVRAKLEQGCTDFLGPDGIPAAHILGAWLGYELPPSPHLAGLQHDPRRFSERALHWLSTLLISAATPAFPAPDSPAPHPSLPYTSALHGGNAVAGMILFLEDLHWGDTQSMQALAPVLRTVAAHPATRLLVLGVARPTLFERLPEWGRELPHYLLMRLAPLNATQMRDLASEILQKAEHVPESLLTLVTERAEGNPFYIEELIKMLIDDGVILTSGEPWRIRAAALDTLEVPATLTGILQTRLDSLGPVEKRHLQRAAVVGRAFWDQALAYLSQPESPRVDRELAEALDRLQRRELIFSYEPAAFAETRQYLFKHALLHDVAYESVLKRDRRLYHQLAARWLERVAEPNGRGDEYAATIAAHYDQAGDARDACHWYERAGAQAADQAAHAEAVRCFTRALALIASPTGSGTPKTDDITRYQLLVARERIHHMQGTRTAQAEDLRTLAELAKKLATLHDPLRFQRQAFVALRSANYYESISDYGAAAEAAQRAVQIAAQGKLLADQADGHLLWGRALWRQAQYPAAREHLHTALDLARAAGVRPLEADALRNLGIVGDIQGEYSAARTYYTEALALQRAIGDRWGESRTLNNLGILASNQGDYLSAQTYYSEALTLQRALGHRAGEAATLNNLAIVAYELGHYDLVRAYNEQALVLQRASDDLRGEGITLSNLGIAFHQLGDYMAARAHYEQALTLQRTIGHRVGESDTLSYFCLLCHHLDDQVAAREYGELAVYLAQSLGARDYLGYAHTFLGHALAALGESSAADHYRAALAVRRELGQPGRATEPLAGLARLAQAAGDLPAALAHVTEILPHRPFDGASESVRVYRTCYQILAAASDPRAPSLLAEAYAHLQEHAARIADPALRASYLANVAAHRALLADYAQATSNQQNP